MDILSYLLGKNASGGGGGGLICEEGTYTPSEDKTEDFINFKKTHDKLPMFLFICDISGTGQETYSMVMQYVINIDGIFGTGFPGTKTSLYYGFSGMWYTSSSVNAQRTSDEILYKTTGNNKYYLGYWITNNGFNLKSSGATTYWKSNRTYKWIAIWQPETE